jgi:tetratricopeptide (TPR) repeat protein
MPENPTPSFENLTQSVADPAATTGTDTSSTAVAPLPLPSARYQLGEEIARGGMGVVYRATDTVLGREVAVKVLQADPGPLSAVARRFTDEAHIAAQLQHPAIPPVHDLGTLPDGRPFLAMKLIRGDTLESLLKARSDPATDRGRYVAVFERVCQAVAYAHDRQVIHRDLKPSNVMVGAFGEVQVMDWGLAKVLASRERERPEEYPEETAAGTVIHSHRADQAHTRAGSVLGTPAYMPPEQALGAIGKIDARSDVFGLGGILAVILTGKPPFESGSAETTRIKAAQGKVDECFARLDASGADPELVALCKRCLNPNPADRPRHAGEVAKAVATLRAAADDRARRAELDRAKAEVHASEQRRRRKVQLALAAAVGLLVAGGGAFGWWQDRQATARRIETENRDRDEREREARHRGALTAALDRGEAALRAGDSGDAGVVLAEIERRLPDGHAPELAPRIARLRAELALLEELARIDSFRWSLRDGKYPEKREVAGRWAKAFAAFGVVPGQTSAAEAGRRVSEALAHDRLLTALDLWLGYAQSRHQAEVLNAADPDEFRDAVRAAVVVADIPGLRALVSRTAAPDQPPRFAVPLGALGDLPADRRRAVLKRAVVARPGDLAVLMTLADTYPRGERAGAAQRVRWYQAAVAAHPRYAVAWNNLGDALRAVGDTSGAIDAFEQAVKFDPALAHAHNNLGVVLEAAGERERAIAAYRESVKQNPKYGGAYHNLALALKDKGDLPGAVENFRKAIENGFRTGQAYNNLGATLERLGDLDGAIEAFKVGVAVAPKDAMLAENLKIVLEVRAERRDRLAPAPREVKPKP